MLQVTDVQKIKACPIESSSILHVMTLNGSFLFKKTPAIYCSKLIVLHTSVQSLRNGPMGLSFASQGEVSLFWMAMGSWPAQGGWLQPHGPSQPDAWHIASCLHRFPWLSSGPSSNWCQGKEVFLLDESTFVSCNKVLLSVSCRKHRAWDWTGTLCCQ